MRYTGLGSAAANQDVDRDIGSKYDIVRAVFTKLDEIEAFNDSVEFFKGATKFEKTSGDGSVGTVDTYTITFNDGTTSTFDIANGTKGVDGTDIVSITRTSGDGSAGTTDTYTVLLSDGTSTAFSVTNGIDGIDGIDGVSIGSIVRTSGDNSAGTVDTYTITKTDGTTSEFSVYNGADGISDMTKAVYDTNDSGVVDNSELLNGKDKNFLLDRANHTGTQDIDTITENANNKIMTRDERDKVANVPSNLTQVLYEKEETSNKGKANGYASLDSVGKVPIDQLPSYVDDVLEFDNRAAFPQTGMPSKIYISKEDNTSWRWTGSIYVDITGAVDSVNGKTGAVNVTKSDVMLGNVDNTSDANKPVSDAAKIELDKKQDLTEKGNANGYASLDSNGKVPTSELPVISSLALGETSTTAYRGDRGKTAYDHSQLFSGNPHNITKADVGLNNVNNTSDLNKPVSTAQEDRIVEKAEEATIAPSATSEDPNTSLKPLFVTNHANTPNSAVFWYIDQVIYFKKLGTSNRHQIAKHYSTVTSGMYERHYISGTWTGWKPLGLSDAQATKLNDLYTKAQLDDKLDNKFSEYALGSDSGPIVDMNETKAPGTYRTSPTTLNSPLAGTYCSVIILGQGSSIVTQQVTGRDNVKTYSRGWNGSVWSGWQQLGGAITSTSAPSGGIDGDFWYRYGTTKATYKKISGSWQQVS